jgi:aspartate/methionine/tyrosine aminotransferase
LPDAGDEKGARPEENFTDQVGGVQWVAELAASMPHLVILDPLVPRSIVAYPFFLAKLLVGSGVARFLPAVQRWTDGGGAFVRYYSDRLLRAPYEEMRALAVYQGLHGPDIIDLSQGAPCFDLVPSGSTKLPADRRGWPPPWGLPELREAVSAKLLMDQRLAVSPADEVLITHGAAGAISTALDAFVNPGDRVVLFDPASPLYRFALRPRRARIRWIPTWMEIGRTRFRLEHLAKVLRGARVIVVNSPTNPTGGVVTPEDMEQIAWWADRRGALILADEVFERYHYEGDSVSIGTLPKARRRTLTVGSLSKGHALACARVGWLAGHRHLIRPCALVASLHTPFVPTLSQQVALAALRQGKEAFVPILAGFKSCRRYAFDRLEAMGLKPSWPTGAFFFWVPVQTLGLSGRSFAEAILRAKNVLVTPGDFFGPSGPGYVRLSYAAEDGRLREGLSRLADFVREQRPIVPTVARRAA